MLSSVTSGSSSGPREAEVVEAAPADFLHVPAHTVHREGNPSDQGAELVVFRLDSRKSASPLAGILL